MTQKKLDLDKPIRFRNYKGTDLLYMGRDPNPAYPLNFVYRDTERYIQKRRTTESGEVQRHKESPLDIINVPTKRWVNVFYQKGRATVGPEYNTREEAKQVGATYNTYVGTVEADEDE